MIDKTFYDLGKWMLAAAIAAAIFIWISGDSWLIRVPDCYFETLTGLYCPGCGGTRAVIALFQGHFIKSFIYHPVVPYAAVVYAVFMVRMFMRVHKDALKEHIHIKKRSDKEENENRAQKNRPVDADGRVLIYIYIGIGLAIIQWIVKLILLIKYDIHVI